MQNMQKDTITVSFCGTFKSGKSSLINALLGTQLLPVRISSATAVVTRVYYSEKPEAYVIRKNADNSLQKDSIFPEEISQYILLKEKNLHGVRISNIQEVGIGIPHPLLRQGIVLVDTPGLDDDKQLSEISFHEMQNADLAVIIYNATKFMSMDEKRAASRLADLLGGNVLFVINKMDMVKDRESLTDVVHFYLSGFGNPIIGMNPTVYTSAEASGLDIGQLESNLKRLTSEPLKYRLSFHSRAHILSQKIEQAMNEALNKREEYRLQAEMLERKHSDSIVGMTKSLRSKMMQLSMRLNNVRYKIQAYLNPFRDMCIQVAKGEGLLATENFNTTLLSLCIEKTMNSFVMQFGQKLKKLFTEFSVDFSVNFSIKAITTAAKIDKYLEDSFRTKGSMFGEVALNVLGADTYTELRRMISGDNSEKYMMAYMMAVDEEAARLKQQINRAIDQAEQQVLKYADSCKPAAEVPPELKKTQQLMDQIDATIHWYRECINKLGLQPE